MPSYKSIVFQKKRDTSAFYNLTFPKSICLIDQEKQIQKVRSILNSLPKVVSKRRFHEEFVQSAKSYKCVPPCVPSQPLQVTDKLRSFPSTAEFSQVKRYTPKPRACCRLDRGWKRALANRSLPAQRTRHEDKNCLKLHCRARGRREAQLYWAKTTTFLTEQRSFQSVNSIAYLSGAFSRCCSNHNHKKIRL